jgi:hypothetical protein
MIRFVRGLIWSARVGAAFSRAERLRYSGKRRAALSIVQKSLIGLDAAGLAQDPPLDTARALLVALGEALAFELEEPGFPEKDLVHALACFEDVDLDDMPGDYALYIPFLRSRIQRLRGNPGSGLMG